MTKTYEEGIAEGRRLEKLAQQDGLFNNLHTYGSFRISFWLRHNYYPTEQEVFNAGVRAGREIQWAKKEPVSNARPCAPVIAPEILTQHSGKFLEHIPFNEIPIGLMVISSTQLRGVINLKKPGSDEEEDFSDRLGIRWDNGSAIEFPHLSSLLFKAA
jgi:hypothetical protein